MAYLAKWMRRCLFICFCLVFLMSHNASAAEVVFDVSNYSTYRYLGNTKINCSFGGGTNNVLTGYWCGSTISGETILYDIRTANDFSLSKGDLITFHIFVRSQTTNFKFGPILSYFGHSDSSFTLIDYHLIDDSNFGSSSVSYNGYVNPPPNNDMSIDFNNYNGFYKIYSITLRSEKDQTSQIYLKGSNNNIAGLFVFNTADSFQTVRFYMTNFTFYHYSESKENKEVEDATQDASDDAAEEIAGDSENAATSNLIGVISNFISAISDFSGGNCNLSLAFPSYAGGTLNVNVCQNKDKAGNIIEVFTSLTLIVFYLPLALKLLSMIYNEIRSFTNG